MKYKEKPNERMGSPSDHHPSICSWIIGKFRIILIVTPSHERMAETYPFMIYHP